jgi:hypothetical protein
MQELFRGRVGLTEEGTRSTTLSLVKGGVRSIDDRTRLATWVSFSKGRMGSTGGNGSTALVSLSNGRVGSTEDENGSTTWVTLFDEE